MQHIGVKIYVFLFGRMILNHPFSIAKKQIPQPAHDRPGGHLFFLSILGAQMAPTPAVADDDLPQVAIDGYDESAIPAGGIVTSYHAGANSPPVCFA